MEIKTKRSKRAEEERLQISEARYRRLFESIQEGILVLNGDTGMVEDANPYLIKMLGCSREDLLGKGLWEVGLFRDIAASKTAFEELQSQDSLRYENQALHFADGRRLQVEFVWVAYQVEGQRVIQCNIRDTTEQARNEVSQLKAEEKYRAAFMTSLDGFYIATLEEGLISEVNDAFEGIFGYPRNELIGRISLELNMYQDPNDRAKMVAELKAKGRVKDLEIKARKKDGQGIIISISVSVLQFDDKPYILGVVRDITAVKQAGEQIRKQQAQQKQMLDAMLDREDRVMELKQEVNELLRRLGEPSRYPGE